MVSVIVLTKNEENDILRCLNSVLWSDDVHVLDSGSMDRTIELAQKFGAKISFNTFTSFGQQRNFALDNLEIKHNWVLFLDADEVATANFREAILSAIDKADDQVAGFYCCWKMMYEGKWLKHCDTFPKWQFRLMRVGMARFKDVGHGQKEDKVEGRIEYIKVPYLHYSMSKGWSEWYDRHNRYSTLEAKVRLHKPPFKIIFAGHGSVRNPALKAWLSRIPGWPVLRFCHAYFYNFGFLEGVPGLIYCINIAIVEFMTQVKMREIRKSMYEEEPSLNIERWKQGRHCDDKLLGVYKKCE
ncbi:glycosyltransferase family 2 protein [Pontibacter toksunensis]|uniref:Glycosyltransferase family 2 protein n=1 Tax=Pontibacter toksunensis TaxID=1332631 RepID=A0ABW6C0A0_9BACT